MSRLALIVLTVTAAACGGSSANRKARSSVYQAGAGATFGGAYLPATAKKGLATYLHYGETNGILGKLITLVATVPQGKVSNVQHHSWCDSSYCYTKTTYDYTPPSEAELAAYANFAQGVMSGGLPMELNMDFYRGDASGFNFELLYRFGWRGFGGFDWAEIAFGFKYHRLSFPDWEHQFTASLAGRGTRTQDLTFKTIAFPVRLMLMPSPKTAIYAQLDWNLLGAFDFDDDPYSHNPSLLQVGVRYWLPLIYLKAGVMINGADFSGGTAFLEAGLEI